MLSAGFSCPHKADHLQLSATNFQIKTKEALGEGVYCLTLDHEPCIEQPLSTAEVTGGQEKMLFLLKLAFSGKLSLVTLQASPS